MRTAAIIGHGRSAEGRGWGPKINACDLVVRLWNCQWQNVADYGTKYDYGFLQVGAGWDQFARAYAAGTIPLPSRGWVSSYLKGPRPAYPPKTKEINQACWVAIGQRFGGAGVTGKLRLTRGTVAGCWALSKAGPLDRCILVGFDNVIAREQLPIEQSYSKEYRENGILFSFEKYREGETKSGNHDFAVEHKVMQAVADANNVELVDARSVW